MGEGVHCLFFKTFILSGSLYTPQSYPTILADVTIYPARFTALLWHVPYYFTIDFVVFAMVDPTYKRIAKPFFRFFYEPAILDS